MTDLVIAYWEFWSKAIPYKGGYLPVFPRTTVPANQPFPYLTYDIADYGMLGQGLDDIYIWTRSGDLQQLSQLEDGLRKAIPHGGVIITLPNNSGVVQISRGTPFYQLYPQEDSAIKSGRALIQVNSYIF